MLCMKPKNLILSFTLAFSFAAKADFSELECLQSQFETETSHGVKPFGFFKNVLKISKNGCDLTVSHEKYRFMKETWNIDVCRAPVHIKKGDGSIEVIKRDGSCVDQGLTESTFCKNLNTLSSVIQDDGLIFAPGIKEDISSEHGKVYCSYMLVENYLRKGKVYSTSGSTHSVMQPQAVEAPKTVEESAVAPENQPFEGGTQSSW
jgi:hypothetical protein